MTPLRDVRYAAATLGTSISNVYRLVAAKQLAYVDVNSNLAAGGRHRRTIRFTDEDLEAFKVRRRIAAVLDGARMTQAASRRVLAATLPPVDSRYG